MQEKKPKKKKNPEVTKEKRNWEVADKYVASFPSE